MKVEVQKRYCYKQSGNYGAGLGYMMGEQARLQAKHPEDRIVVELNERSTSTRYRLVRISSIEVEVPEMPTPEQFGVPARYPRAKRLKDSEFENRVETKIERVTPAWQKQEVERTFYEMVMTHRPSGTTERRRVWSTNPSWEYGDLKKRIEQQLDSTFRERVEDYKARNAEYETAVREWRKQCEAAYGEVKTAV